jgi:hypothetical protein
MDPVRTVAPGLARYAGAYVFIEWERIEPGSWVYDTARKLLIYRIINERYFKTELVGPKRLRYRIEPRFVDRNGNGRFDPASERAIGISVVSLDAGALAP